MAKQASKAKTPESTRSTRAAAKVATTTRGAGGTKASPAGSAGKRSASRPTSKRTPAEVQKSGSSEGAKRVKLKTARKAITSSHGAPGAKAAGEGRSSAAGKKTATPGGPEAARQATRAKPSVSPKPAQKKRRSVKRVTFDRKTLASIKKSLLDQQEDLRGQLEDIEEAAFSPSQTEASSEAGFDEDYADAGTATFEREKDLSIANNINSLLDKIDKALEKIEEGTYGICENCGQPISADRLKALPHVFLCINCKKAEERR